MSHTDNRIMIATNYMLANADSFFQKVAEHFSQPNIQGIVYDMAAFLRSTEGLVQAHGSNVEQYRDHWEGLGMDFNKAQLIYLLTYTSLFGKDWPKYRSKQWVAVQYPFYSRFLP